MGAFLSVMPINTSVREAGFFTEDCWTSEVERLDSQSNIRRMNQIITGKKQQASVTFPGE